MDDARHIHLMKIDAPEILDRLKSRKDGVRRSIFVSESIYLAFQKACADIPVSAVLEELMRQFVESAKSAAKKD